MPPWLVLLLLLSAALALTYGLATGHYGWRLVAYWVVVFVALIGCESLAESVGWSYFRVGDLRLLPDMLGGFLALAVLQILRV